MNKVFTYEKEKFFPDKVVVAAENINNPLASSVDELEITYKDGHPGVYRITFADLRSIGIKPIHNYPTGGSWIRFDQLRKVK